MNKKILLFLLALFSFKAIANPDIIVSEVKGVRELKRKLEELRLPVDETVFVFDCDGTLTNESTPTAGKKAVSRGDAVELLKAISAENYPVIVSSAWHDFNDFLRKIRDLGLAEVLKLDVEDDDNGFHIARRHKETTEFTEIVKAEDFAKSKCLVHTTDSAVKPKFSFLKPTCTCNSNVEANKRRVAGRVYFIQKQGQIVSVAGQYSDIDRFSQKLYYRQKALAPMVVYPGRKFKHVVFVDDNLKSLTILERDVKTASYLLSPERPTGGAAGDVNEKGDVSKVHFFFLPGIYGGQVNADLVDADTDDEDSGSYEEADAPNDSDDAGAAATTTGGSTTDPATSTSGSGDVSGLSFAFAAGLSIADLADDDDDAEGGEAEMRELALSKSTDSLNQGEDSLTHNH